MLRLKKFDVLWFKRKRFKRHFRIRHSSKLYSQLENIQNEMTSPRSGEQSKIWYFWATEFYAPSHAADLLDGFDRLGWNIDKHKDDRKDPSAWLKDLRSSGNGRGWMTLPLLVKGDNKNTLHGALENPLIDGVTTLSIQLFALTSSLSSIVYRFELSNEYSKTFDNILNTNYRTRYKVHGVTESMYTPLMQKEQQIENFRRTMQNNIFFWIKQNLPGLFCSSAPNSYLPTCEFVLLSKRTEEAGEYVSKRFQSYINVLRYNDLFSTWRSPNLNTFVFCERTSYSKFYNWHSAFSIEENALQSLDMSLYGGHTTESYQTYFDGALENLFCFWSCGCLIDFFQKKINDLRDASFKSGLKLDPKNLLKTLTEVTTMGVDIASVTPDLQRFESELWTIFYERLPFLLHSKHTVTLEFWQGKAKGLKIASFELQRSEKMLREFLIQQSNLVNASENILVQRQMRNLTRAVIILTVVSLFVSAFGLYFQLNLPTH